MHDRNGTLGSQATRISRALLPLCPLALGALVLGPLVGHAQAPAVAAVIEGRAHIVDGDTLDIGIHRVELYGIDAPEPEQHCRRAGAPWRCGMEATYAMAALIEFHWVTCLPRAQGPAMEALAECRLGGPQGISVNEEIVRRGWALALPASGADYVTAERAAQAAKVGLWSGTFEAPWLWRRARQSGAPVN